MQNILKHLKSWEGRTLILLLGILIISGVIFVGELQKGDHMRPERPIRSIFSGSMTPLIHPTLADTEKIEEWMTFGYISHQFSLPRDYLKTALGIEDDRYPDIPLRGYAKKHDIDKTTFLMSVRNAVVEYISSHRP